MAQLAAGEAVVRLSGPRSTSLVLQLRQGVEARVPRRTFQNACMMILLNETSTLDRSGDDRALLFLRRLSRSAEPSDWAAAFQEAVPSGCYAEYLAPTSAGNQTHVAFQDTNRRPVEVEGAWCFQVLGTWQQCAVVLDAFVSHVLRDFTKCDKLQHVLQRPVVSGASTWTQRLSFTLQPLGTLRSDLLHLTKYALARHRFFHLDGSFACPDAIFPDLDICGALPNAAAVAQALDRRERLLLRDTFGAAAVENRKIDRVLNACWSPKRRRVDPDRNEQAS